MDDYDSDHKSDVMMAETILSIMLILVLDLATNFRGWGFLILNNEYYYITRIHAFFSFLLNLLIGSEP